MITGAAKVAGVVGWPVAHSLSPLIHNAWIEALGLDAAYVPFAVPPERFEAFLEGARGVVSGLNVTLPYKTMLHRYDWVMSEVVWDICAGNLVLFLKEDVFVDSTDGVGLMAALAEQAPGWRPENGPVVVLGSGGAAASAVDALARARAHELRVVARRPQAAACLAEKVYVFEAIDLALRDATLVINATSAGLNGVGELPAMDAAPPGAVFMDMVYKPLRTPFLRDAAARGHPTVDGLAMLIGQARPSFAAFFGVWPPPAEVVDVRALCLRALGESA